MEDNKKELNKQLMLLQKLKKLSDEHLKKLKNVPEETIRTSSRGNFHQMRTISGTGLHRIPGARIRIRR